MTAEEVLKKIYDGLENDSCCWWLPEWCVSKEVYNNCPEKPSYEEFIEKIKER